MHEEKVISEVLERKEEFLKYKNLYFKKPQNVHFSK